MTATPGQAARPAIDVHIVSDQDALYLVCLTEDDSDAECGKVITEIEAGNTWHELAGDVAAHAADHPVTVAQDPPAAPGPLRAALEATLSDWRDDATYRPTDTRDEITEHHAVTGCADTLAGILADHPDTEPKPAPEARTALAAAIHELIDGNCPDIPMCPKCERRKGELLDLADDYAAAAVPDSPLANDNASLRKQRDRLSGQLQAVRQLMADAAANGMIDSQAILDQLNAAPPAPQPAPELAATVLAEVLDFLDGGIPPGDEFALQVAQWRKRGLPS